MENKNEYLTIWQRLENGYWVNVRTRSAHTAKRNVQEWNETCLEADRLYDCFPVDVNPNMNRI